MAYEATEHQMPPRVFYTPETPEEWRSYHEWVRGQHNALIELMEKALDEIVADPWHASGIAHDAIMQLADRRQLQAGRRWEPRP